MIAAPDLHDPLLVTLHGFLQTIRKPCRILVAVSGGSDSLGLLIALHELLHSTRQAHVTLLAATIDHDLRAESAQEAQEVAALCAQRGIVHLIRRWDAPKPATGIAVAARLARYRLLSEAAAALKADVIFTGHTLDDQTETIAMRHARSESATTAGRFGMADHVLYRNQIWIYRPLLNCRRHVMRDFLTARGVRWIDDPSNSNPHYERARVRAELSQHVAVAPVPAQHERLWLSKTAATMINAHAHMPANGVVALHTDAFQAPAPVLRHALQMLLATLGGQSHGPADPALATLITLLDKPAGARLTLGRCLAHRSAQAILLVREARNLPSITLAPQETVVWDGRWCMTNHNGTPLHIRPSRITVDKPLETTPMVPPSILALGQQSMPLLALSDDDSGQHVRMNTSCQRVISPYETFLPGFDWPLACALAELFQTKRFFPPYF